jgi:hypothetical protein
MIPTIYILIPEYMNKKMGRPTLPKGLAKDVQIGVRIHAEDDKKISKAITASGGGETKAQWIRDAARLVAHESVICNDYSVEDLDGKSVWFKIYLKNGMPVEGGGKLMALQRGDGSLKIQIESREVGGPPDVFYRFLMRQESVPWIKKLPPGSRFDFEIVDPSLKGLTRRPGSPRCAPASKTTF